MGIRVGSHVGDARLPVAGIDGYRGCHGTRFCLEPEQTLATHFQRRSVGAYTAQSWRARQHDALDIGVDEQSGLVIAIDYGRICFAGIDALHRVGKCDFRHFVVAGIGRGHEPSVAHTAQRTVAGAVKHPEALGVERGRTTAVEIHGLGAARGKHHGRKVFGSASCRDAAVQFVSVDDEHHHAAAGGVAAEGCARTARLQVVERIVGVEYHTLFKQKRIAAAHLAQAGAVMFHAVALALDVERGAEPEHIAGFGGLQHVELACFGRRKHYAPLGYAHVAFVHLGCRQHFILRVAPGVKTAAEGFHGHLHSGLAGFGAGGFAPAPGVDDAFALHAHSHSPASSRPCR